MSFLSWILVGLATGLLASLIQDRYGPLEDAIVAVVGAVVGGWLYAAISGTSVTEFSEIALAAALLGSTIFLASARMITRGRRPI